MSSESVLLADDQRLVRESLATMLGLLDGVELVARASDGEEACALVAEHRPDVVLMDPRMPRVDGIEATRRLREETPDACGIALTTHADDETVIAALQAGVATSRRTPAPMTSMPRSSRSRPATRRWTPASSTTSWMRSDARSR